MQEYKYLLWDRSLLEAIVNRFRLSGRFMMYSAIYRPRTYQWMVDCRLDIFRLRVAAVDWNGRWACFHRQIP